MTQNICLYKVYNKSLWKRTTNARIGTTQLADCQCIDTGPNIRMPTRRTRAICYYLSGRVFIDVADKGLGIAARFDES